MPVSPRLIRRRIRSIANTRKITKAMELVAAAKMRRSVSMTTASRAYSSTAKRIVDDVRRLVDPATHPLLAGRPTPLASLVIVVSADRGLCGGFNSQIVKKTLEFLATRTETDIRIVTVGKRAESAIKRAGYPILAAFEAISNAPSFEKSRPVGELAYRAFMDAAVDRVFVMYTD
ncbi:MAG: F0F1 ATP synthase subunit gamma, partial [Patescibacteria group bacterium]